MRLHFFGHLSFISVAPTLHAARWQTDVDQKMVDQWLFPAHPNWRWLDGAAWLWVWSHFLLETLQNPTAALHALAERQLRAPLIPVLVSCQDQRGLDAAGRNSCSNEKQQSTSVDEFLLATNLAACDNNPDG